MNKANIKDLKASLQAFINASDTYKFTHDSENAHDARIIELADRFPEFIKRLKPYTKTEVGELSFNDIKELHRIYIDIGTALYEFQQANRQLDENERLVSVGVYPSETLSPLLCVADFVFLGLEAMDAYMKEKHEQTKKPSSRMQPIIIKISDHKGASRESP